MLQGQVHTVRFVRCLDKGTDKSPPAVQPATTAEPGLSVHRRESPAEPAGSSLVDARTPPGSSMRSRSRPAREDAH